VIEPDRCGADKEWVRLVLVSLVLVLGAAGCGAANDSTRVITSTPDATALAVAEQNVRDATTAVESYFTTNGSYAGATVEALRGIDPGLSPTVSVTQAAGGYCVQSVVDGVAASLRGPGGGVPQPGAC